MANFFASASQPVNIQTVREQMVHIDRLEHLKAVDLLKALTRADIINCRDLNLIKAWRNKLCEHPYAENVLKKLVLNTAMVFAGCGVWALGVFSMVEDPSKEINLLAISVMAATGFAGYKGTQVLNENQRLTSSVGLLNDKIVELGSREDLKAVFADAAKHYSFLGLGPKKKLA